MKIMMLKNAVGMANASGGETVTYEAGKEYEGKEGWQVKTFSFFVSNGVANEVGGNAAPAETKKSTKKSTKKPRSKKTA
jgi:hypothetical protein